MGLKKYSATSTKVYFYWKEACVQRSRIGLVVIQDELTQPRASSAFWSVPVLYGRGVLSNSLTVWWLGRFQHKGISFFYQRLRSFSRMWR